MQKYRSSFWSFLLLNPVALLQLSSVPLTPNLIFPEPSALMDNGCYSVRNERVWVFGWSAIPKATSYHLYVIGANAVNPAINNPNIKSTDYIERSVGYIANQNRMGWRWKVRAMVNGEWSNWSQERVFHVEPLNTDCQ